jgi:hypothetical protein
MRAPATRAERGPAPAPRAGRAPTGAGADPGLLARSREIERAPRWPGPGVAVTRSHPVNPLNGVERVLQMGSLAASGPEPGRAPAQGGSESTAPAPEAGPVPRSRGQAKGGGGVEP